MSVPMYATQSRYVQVPICSWVPVQWMCLLWLLNWKWSGLALTSRLLGEQHAAQCLKSGKRMLFYWLTEKCQNTLRKLTESSTVSDGASLVVGQLGLFYRLWHLQSCVQGHLHKEEITLGSKLRHPQQRAFVKAKCRQMTWKGLRDCRSKFKSRLLMKMISSLRNEQVSFPLPSWILWDWEARCLYLFPNLATSCRYPEGRKVGR